MTAPVVRTPEVTADRPARAWYVRVLPRSVEVAKTEDRGVVECQVDYDAEGRVVGVEFLGTAGFGSLIDDAPDLAREVTTLRASIAANAKALASALAQWEPALREAAVGAYRCRQEIERLNAEVDRLRGLVSKAREFVPVLEDPLSRPEMDAAVVKAEAWMRATVEEVGAL